MILINLIGYSFLHASSPQKYGDKDLGVKGVGDNKRGPSAFHPGYKHFRASSWAKVNKLYVAYIVFDWVAPIFDWGIFIFDSRSS